MSFRACLAAEIRLMVLFFTQAYFLSDGIKAANTKLREKGWAEHKC